MNRIIFMAEQQAIGVSTKLQKAEINRKGGARRSDGAATLG
jgi:hypothetical protein